MKIIKFALLLLHLSCAYGNPVKRDGVVYEVLRALPQDEIPVVIVNVDQSEESKSDEAVPLEFPEERTISIDQMIFKDGAWHEMEKPTVVIKRDDSDGWINSDIPSIKRIHGGAGVERKDRFNSSPEIVKRASGSSGQSMSTSTEDRIRKMEKALTLKKLAKANSEPSMSESVESIPLEKIRKIAMANSEPSMSASAESIPLETIKKIADSEPSMTASDENRKQPSRVIVIPIDDTNLAKEIDLVIEPEGEQVIKIERNSDSNEISYNLIDSDLNGKHVEVKTSKTTEEEEESQKTRSFGLLNDFYRRFIGSFLTAIALNRPPTIE